MTEIQNIKPVWVIEKLRIEIYLACDEPIGRELRAERLVELFDICRTKQ